MDLQIIFFPAGVCPGGGEGGLVFICVWPFIFPLFLIDLPLSLIGDTLILPYTIYRQTLYGNIENKWEDPDEYTIRYRTAEIKKNPNKAGLYNSRGREYYTKGKFKEAIADFSKSIEISPKNAFGYFWRGVSWLKIGKNEKSIADFSKTIEIDSKYVHAYFYRAEAHVKLNQNKSAAEDYYKYLKYREGSSKPDEKEIIKKMENIGYSVEYFIKRTKDTSDEGRKDVPVVSPSQFKEPVILDTTVHEIKEILPAPREEGNEHPLGMSINKTYQDSPPGPTNNEQPKTEPEKNE